MLWEFGTNSVQLRERKNGFLVPKRHRMKHLDFLSFLLESKQSIYFPFWVAPMVLANENLVPTMSSAAMTSYKPIV
jgi:hypothetical protein